jgi:hypothetical protein
MKANLIALGTLLTIGRSALAAMELPDNHSLTCWDQTFFYNRLVVTKVKGEVAFDSSSQDLSVYQTFVKQKKQTWGELHARFSIPQANCKVFEHDKKLMTCSVDLLDITFSGDLNLVPIKKSVSIGYATIKIQKLEAVSQFSNLTKGYELEVEGLLQNRRVSLRQKYFYGMELDETDRCALK